MLDKRQDGFARPKLILMVFIIFLIIAGFSIYYFLWRVPDSEYTSAATPVQKMSASSDEIAKMTERVQLPGVVDDATEKAFEKSATSYKQALTDLDKSTILAKDASVRQAYDQYKDNLRSFGQSVSDIAQSLKLYRAAVYACGDMIKKLNTVATVNDFDIVAKGCVTATGDEASSPSKPFNDQFYGKYLAATASLTDAYKQLVSGQTPAKLTAIDEKAKQLQAIALTKVNYNLPQNPLSEIQKLSTLITSQKNTFWR